SRLHSLIPATKRGQNAREKILFHNFVPMKFAQLLKFRPSRIMALCRLRRAAGDASVDAFALGGYAA
ncbi:hypothetical protein ACC679_39180, partial [Rhizobium ruizarguesonis]